MASSTSESSWLWRHAVGDDMLTKWCGVSVEPGGNVGLWIGTKEKYVSSEHHHVVVTPEEAVELCEGMLSASQRIHDALVKKRPK